MKDDTAWFGVLTRSALDSLMEYYETNEFQLATIKKRTLLESIKK